MHKDCLNCVHYNVRAVDHDYCVGCIEWDFTKPGLVRARKNWEADDRTVQAYIAALQKDEPFEDTTYEISAPLAGLPKVGPSEPTATKRMVLSTNAEERKGTPIATGVLDYFPRALAEVAKCSKAGNDQHNPGKPLQWDRTKSTDHADCIARHLIDRGTRDTDGIRHSAKLAWRALALLEVELERERQ